MMRERLVVLLVVCPIPLSEQSSWCVTFFVLLTFSTILLPRGLCFTIVEGEHNKSSAVAIAMWIGRLKAISTQFRNYSHMAPFSHFHISFRFLPFIHYNPFNLALLVICQSLCLRLSAFISYISFGYTQW